MDHVRCFRALWLNPISPFGRPWSCPAIIQSCSSLDHMISLGHLPWHLTPICEWVKELSPWYHFFVLPTPCTVSIGIRKIIPLFHILRKPVFLQKPAANAANSSQSWTAELWPPKISLLSTTDWQADQQPCNPAAEQWCPGWEGFGCGWLNREHLQHPVDHGWPSCASFFSWLTQFICFTQFDFLGKCGNFLLAFTSAPASNIWWASASCSCWHRSALCGCLIALSCYSWTPVWQKTFKDLWKARQYLYGKKLLVSEIFLIFDVRAWNREFGCLLWSVQWGFSFTLEYPC